LGRWTQDTVEFFAEHKNFGLRDIVLLEQGAFCR
jgi:hypothetical protein